MSKYDELVTLAEKTEKEFHAIKERVTGDFVSRLSQAMGCDRDKMEVEFGDPQYLDRNNMMTWGFTVTIAVGSYRFSLPFSMASIRDKGADSPVILNYQGHRISAGGTLDKLSAIISQDIQTAIEGKIGKL
ncbi:MAG TPA: hypothetical protein PK022_08590 [Syntrophales bacterium]|nr:hypothetical protein [Syntrophales bacterium]